MEQPKDKKQPAIIFDLGGVLIDWNPRHLFKPIFDGRDEELDYFLSVVCPQSWNAEQDRGRSFKAAVEERCQLFPDYTPYIQAYHLRWGEMVKGPIEETVEILHRLKEQDHALFALSNWSAETFSLVHERFDFFTCFDDMVISGDVKMIKPDPEIFQLLLKRIDRKADACLFIDDSAENIETAEQLGFETFHFTGAKDLLADLLRRGIL